MTNEQIIKQIAINIYGEEAVGKMIEKLGEIPLHTIHGWTSRGPYKVKKGEHGIETRLWRKKKTKIKWHQMKVLMNKILRNPLMEIFIFVSLIYLD